MKKNTLHIPQYRKYQKIFPRSLPSPYNMYEECAGSVRAMRWRENVVNLKSDGHSHQPKGSTTETKKNKLGHTNNRVVTRILVAIIRKKKNTCCNAHWKDVCSSSSSPKPQIAIDSARSVSQMSISSAIRCTCPPSSCGVTLYLSLVVRRWCRAFLLDPLSMEENFAENVCQLIDVLRILQKSRVWRSHPVSHQSSHWSPFRVGLANVPHLPLPR